MIAKLQAVIHEELANHMVPTPLIQLHLCVSEAFVPGGARRPVKAAGAEREAARVPLLRAPAF